MLLPNKALPVNPQDYLPFDPSLSLIFDSWKNVEKPLLSVDHYIWDQCCEYPQHIERLFLFALVTWTHFTSCLATMALNSSEMLGREYINSSITFFASFPWHLPELGMKVWEFVEYKYNTAGQTVLPEVSAVCSGFVEKDFFRKNPPRLVGYTDHAQYLVCVPSYIFQV